MGRDDTRDYVQNLELIKLFKDKFGHSDFPFDQLEIIQTKFKL
jgi:hypothetical protein